MSKPYEDLTDAEKLVNSTHFPGKTGPTLKRVMDAIQHQLDNLILSAGALVKDSFQLNNSWGIDVTEVGDILDVVRFVNETDEAYRNRVIVAAATFETVTVDAILDLYENLIGKRPTIQEAFRTKVFQSGDPPGADEGGKFSVVFEIPITKRSESLRVASDRTSVIASDDSIVSPYTASLSTNINTTTSTVPVGSTANFADWGELFIDNEWVSYSTKASDSFGGCIRGLYDSVPATHATNNVVIEGTTKVFLRDTNNAVFSTNTDDQTRIGVSGGPYDWDTYFDVQYKITDDDLKEEFDTPAELGAALDQLQVIGYDFKAAGINASIFMGSVLSSWFQAEQEVLVITDSLSLDASEIHFLDFFVWSATPDKIAYFESAWDDADYEWDGTLWTQAYWDGNSWERLYPKGWYKVEISAHT